MLIKLNKIKLFLVACILIVACSVVFFVYMQWDMERFKERLIESPTLNPTPKVSDQLETTSPEVVQSTAPITTIKSKDSDSLVREFQSEHGDDVDIFTLFLEAFTEDIENSLEDLEVEIETDETIVQEEHTNLPYDMDVVKAGYEDYNLFLASNPKYAYQRLDDAFREQYGDYSDVDILVENVRRSNNGTVTIDDTIAEAEALLRLMSRVDIHPGNIDVVENRLEHLRESKQLILESGVEVPFRVTYHIGGSE